MDIIYKKLAEIVGESYVSNSAEDKFIYSRDQGLQTPHEPDFIIMPGSPEEISKIVLLANEEKIPLVPMGGGLVLSGLTIPLNGGIVIDTKRMNKIIEVNESSRYALVECGTGQGKLQSYLNKNHPSLKHSMPDSPPGATIAGNVSIHGSGHLSQSEGGFHSEMVTGLEVVLPTGEIIKTGSCSIVDSWFSRAPLPDLAGLFLGWNGTTGIITKVAIKLFPKPLLNDVMLYLTRSIDDVIETVKRLTATGMVEDLISNTVSTEKVWLAGKQAIKIHITANSDFEMKAKKKVIRESLRGMYDTKESGFMPIPFSMKPELLEVPNKIITAFADTDKGGGFEYIGTIMPLDKLPVAVEKGKALAQKYKISFTLGFRVVGRAHSIMFFYCYAFNRDDPDSLKRVREALHETNRTALEIGALPWKADAGAQQNMLSQMDGESRNLIKKLKKVLDPNGIMNPGNWEVE